MTSRDAPEGDDHEHADGCLCGHDHGEHDATHDQDLPAAAGGVEGERKPRRRRATRTAAEGED